MAGIVATWFGLVWAVHIAGLLTLLWGLLVGKMIRETLRQGTESDATPNRSARQSQLSQ